MVTKCGPKVVEYNCRLGDPETQAVLAVYGGDLLDLFYKASAGRVKELAPINHQGYAAVVVMSSEGYPDQYKTGVLITGISEAEKCGVYILHAGTKKQDGDLLTAGGRVLGVVGKGDTLKAAIDTAYAGVKKIKFEGMHFRKDIGKKGGAELSSAKSQKLRVL
jgi:phosphoribosylamine--glycine ligase